MGAPPHRNGTAAATRCVGTSTVMGTLSSSSQLVGGWDLKTVPWVSGAMYGPDGTPLAASATTLVGGGAVRGEWVQLDAAAGPAKLTSYTLGFDPSQAPTSRRPV